MSRIFLMIIGLAFSVSVPIFGQDTVPEPVLLSHNSLYQEMSEIVWVHRSEGWDVEFSQGDREYTVSYTEEGEWTRIEKDIWPEEVPELIQISLRGHFANAFIEKAVIISLPGDIYQYEIIGGDHRQGIVVIFDADGNLLSQRTEAYGEDDEEPYEGDN